MLWAAVPPPWTIGSRNASGTTAPELRRGVGVVTRHLEGKIVESRYLGPIVFDGQLDRDLSKMLAAHRGMHWLIDASGATGIDPSRREYAGNTIQLFRDGGGGSMAAVVPSGPIRMVASALSFGFDLRLRLFAEREEALAYLRALP
jgi:hypothetical protein